ncbi:hypothetical protein V8E54_015287 [Elaphomyces granulatus]
MYDRSLSHVAWSSRTFIIHWLLAPGRHLRLYNINQIPSTFRFPIRRPPSSHSTQARKKILFDGRTFDIDGFLEFMPGQEGEAREKEHHSPAHPWPSRQKIFSSSASSPTVITFTQRGPDIPAWS